MNTYTTIEWRSPCDLHGTYYRGGFQQKLFVDADLVKPEYPVEQSGGQDNDGYFVADVQRWEKRAVLSFPCSDFLADALFHASMACDFMLYPREGGTLVPESVAVSRKAVTDCVSVVTLECLLKSVTVTHECGNMTVGDDL